MATPNPLTQDYPPVPKVSKKIFFIAGIIVNVYGLEELSSNVTEVACLWLLHPRLSKKESMEPVAAASIAAWQAKSQSTLASKQRGLIAVAFDQRNHGSRLVDKLSNEAWARKNPRHAQDMFSTFQGTAADVSQLITYLPAYLFPKDQRTIVTNMVLGISLGAHAAWHCILHDDSITTAVTIIGCADYYRLMAQRAAVSKLSSWISTDPPGKTFKGSKDFPKALIQAVDKYDPASLLMGEMAETSGKDVMRDPTEQERKRITPLMRDHLRGKRIFNLAGADDKLVPYTCSEAFLQWLKKAISPGGWFAGQDVHLEDKVYPGVGHAFSPGMMRDSVAFIVETMSRESQGDVARM